MNADLVHTTLDRLPDILGRTPEHVFRNRSLYPAIDVPRLGYGRSAASGLPVVRVYDIAAALEIERRRQAPLPPDRPIAPSPFAKTEMIRRRHMVRQLAMQERGRLLTFPRGQVGRDSFHAELSYPTPAGAGLPSVPLVVHLRLTDDQAALAAYSSRDADVERLRSIAHGLAARVDEIDARIEAPIRSVLAEWLTRLDERIEAVEADFRPTYRIALQQQFNKAISIASGEKKVVLALRRELDRIVVEASTAARRAADRIELERRSGFDRYPSQFPLARSLGRRVLFHAGPTNSGKTHAALQLAAAAASAQILSPLRLLALEHRDALVASGVDAGLITGEERENVDSAHIARTIETADLDRQTEVAIIDEIQMLGDASRGWAWTQALIGIPADLVVLTGSAEAIPIVERIVASLGEELEIRHFARKNPLTALPAPVPLRQLRRGDALIAFSRREVHEYRELVRQSGLSVAALYGALGPEVRRSEAARFRDGRADVVIATDAIGMGLNLPIARVVFSTTEKFYGVRTGPLSPSAILQIAGRAGRFGHFSAGEVTVLRGADDAGRSLERIASALRKGPPPLDGKAYVRPNLASIRAASEMLETDALAPILTYLGESLVRNHPDLRMSDLSDDLSKVGRIDALPLPMEVRYAYLLTPIGLKSPIPLAKLVAWGHEHARNGTVEPYLPPPTGTLEEMEAQANICTSWLWLSQRFDDVYERADEVRTALAELNAGIENRLAKTSGERMQKPRRERRAQSEPPDPDLEPAP